MMLAALPLKAYRHPARIRPPEIAAELLPALWTSLDAYLAMPARSDRGIRGYFRYRTRIRACPPLGTALTPMKRRRLCGVDASTSRATGTPGRCRINEKR